MSVTYIFEAEFTKSKAKVTPANSPTVDVWDASNPAGALLVSAGSATQITNETGYYMYSYTATSPLIAPTANFHTADTTVDMQDLPSRPSVTLDTNGNVLTNVQSWLGVTPNVLQSGRVDTYVGAMASGVIAAATFAANALDAVWSTATRALTDKTGFELSAAGILALWNQLTNDVGISAGSFAAKLRDWVLGTDHKALISTDAQDVSATLHVDAKTLNGATPNNLAAGAQMDLVNAPNATAITAIQSGLATAAKLLSYFKSIFRNDVTADADLGGTATSAADSLQALQVSGISVTFPQSAANIISAVSGTKITAQPDTKWTFALTLPIAIDLTNYTSLLFTVKDDTTKTDAQALVQIEKNKSGTGDGLLYINAQTPTAAGVVAGDGSISITDSTHIVVTLNANAAALLAVQSNLIHYEVKQVVSATDATILSDGRNLFALVADVARAV